MWKKTFSPHPRRSRRKNNSSSRWSPHLTVPCEDDLRLAAFILNEAKRPVILVGQGALCVTDEVIDVADKLGAPIVKALLGKGWCRTIIL